MEDIDAAVEDAEYVKAMRDNVPRPTKSWDWLNSGDLETYISHLMAHNPEGLRLEKIASTSLGLYLVGDHIFSSVLNQPYTFCFYFSFSLSNLSRIVDRWC